MKITCCAFSKTSLIIQFMLCFAGSSLTFGETVDVHGGNSLDDCLRNISFRCVLEGGDDTEESTWEFVNKGNFPVQVWGVLISDKSHRQIYPVDWLIPAFAEETNFTLRVFSPILSGVCEFNIASASSTGGRSPFLIDEIGKIDLDMIRTGAIETHDSNKRNWFGTPDTISCWIYNPAQIPIGISKLEFDFSGLKVEYPVDIRIEPMSWEEAIVKLPMMPSKAKEMRALVKEIRQPSPAELPGVVAMRFLKAMEEGDIQEAKKDVEIITYGGLEKWSETLRENRDIGFVRRIAKTEIDKTEATVRVVSEAKSNDGLETVEEEQTIHLIKENGYWRVHLSKE